MSSFGVTDDGFNPKLINDILSDVETQEESDFGTDIATHGESVLGQLNATFAAAVAESWEVLHAVYRSLYPNSATGEALDQVCSFNDVTRLPATKSTITLECAGSPGTLLLVGRVVSVDLTGERFVSTENKTIGTGGTVDVPFESENYGPIFLGTGQDLTIETPVAGWSTVAANEDADLGRDLETDAALRLRRAQLLQAQASGTIEAIRTGVLNVDGVSSVYVYENVSMVTDGRSLPPKSFEVIVEGGTDADVAQAIFDNKPAGIDSYGHAPEDVSVVVTDSMSINHTIKFTRPDPNPIYIRADITYDPNVYGPSTDDLLVKQALAALGNELLRPSTIIYERFQAEVFSIPGVIDCPVFYIDTVSPPTGTSNLPFDVRDAPSFDTGDITINSTPAV